MIQTIDLRGVQPTRAAFQRLVPRPVVDVQVAMSVASDLIADVRERGVAALREQAERFDGGAPASLRAVTCVSSSSGWRCSSAAATAPA